MPAQIVWYGHDSFRLTDGRLQVYVDPWKLPAGVPRADVICITHEHFDHCSPEDVQKISGPATTLIVSPSCAEKFPAAKVVSPGQQATVGAVTIETVPAYNPAKNFHPNDGTRVGYVITIGGQRIYHTGDTDLIPEMETIRADVALLPVSGTYVMTAEEAAQAVAILKPTSVIPMHYGSIIGTRAEAERFAELVGKKSAVTILPKTE